MIRIVHLSDFHIDLTGIHDLEQFIMKALIKDLLKFNEEQKIDLIIFSGDLIDKGGISFGDTELALYTFHEKVIDPILNALSLKNNQFFFVPGNHDLDLKADSLISESGLTTHLKSTPIVNEYIDNNDQEGRKRIFPFKTFEKDFYSEYEGTANLTEFQSNFIINNSSTTIGVTCFNSSWRCFDELDKNKIILGERQVTNSRTIISESDIKIAIIHHPIDWLNEFEIESIEAMVTRDYDMLFCGHVHKGTTWSKTNTHGELFYSISPSNWKYGIRSNERDYNNGYSIVDYDKANRRIEVYNRRYSHLKEKYDPNTDMGDDRGYVSYSLPDTEELQKKKIENSFINRIKDVHLNDINEHLLSYSTDTSAPKTIDDMFVLPQLVNDKKFNTDERDSKYTLDGLCKIQENLLIVGSKESGKTILLDKILIELTNNFDKHKKIPVYINFNHITNRIETLMSRFLGISVLDISSILKKHKVILLLDDISFSDSKKVKLKILEEFLTEFPNVQVMSTVTGIMEEEVPLQIFDYNLISNFKIIHIQNFKTREIKALIKKWFSHNENYDPEKLNKIVHLFTSLNIPRTPLAVSMFLWIIEQQENYKPINNAVMLENFIERLFKKQSRKEIFSERFDYRNKERLLSEIAYKMYTNDQVNYRISHNELRNFIYEYLKIMKFSFDEEALVKDFVNSGVLITESSADDTYLRFRFTCFFRYFLMKYMNFDEDFKKHVLSEDYYLFFEDEIDYYTGLYRDQSVILQLLVNRMKLEFEELLHKINIIPNGFDAIFETKNSIASSLDTTEVKTLITNKPTEDELEQMNDNMLENSTQEKGIPRKDIEISLFEKLFRSWSLAAKALKNTEETKVKNLKGDSLEEILLCSIAFASVYKLLLTEHLEKITDHEQSEDNHEKINILNRFMPLIHQLVTFSYLGTGKLGVVIRESIEKKLYDNDTSDMEKFMIIFLYADLKEENYHSYLSKFVAVTQSTYILDMILFKITSYYYLRSSSPKSDNFYENLIGDIILKSKRTNKRNKHEIIERYRSKKLTRQREEYEDLNI